VRFGFAVRRFLGVNDVFRNDVDPLVSPSTDFGFHRVFRPYWDLLEEDIVRGAHGHVCSGGKDRSVSLKSEIHSSSISILGITPVYKLGGPFYQDLRRLTSLRGACCNHSRPDLRTALSSLSFDVYLQPDPSSSSNPVGTFCGLWSKRQSTLLGGSTILGYAT
jgi:hypothetical protein